MRAWLLSLFLLLLTAVPAASLTVTGTSVEILAEVTMVDAFPGPSTTDSESNLGASSVMASASASSALARAAAEGSGAFTSASSEIRFEATGEASASVDFVQIPTGPSAVARVLLTFTASFELAEESVLLLDPVGGTLRILADDGTTSLCFTAPSLSTCRAVVLGPGSYSLVGIGQALAGAGVTPASESTVGLDFAGALTVPEPGTWSTLLGLLATGCLGPLRRRGA